MRRAAARLHTVPVDGWTHLAGVVEELGAVRVQLVGLLRRVQTDVFASHHLRRREEGDQGEGPRCVNKQLTEAETWTRLIHKDAHLSQEVVLRVVVQRGDGACGPEPGVDRHLLLVSLPQAAVIGEADVCFQLGDLRRHPSGTSTGEDV